MNITLLVLLIFVPILALILLGLNLLLAPHKAYEAKLSPFECGMQPIPNQTRESFQIHFYLIAMLFLVFDLELVLLLPLSVTLNSISTYGFWVAVLFFVILTVGFVLEIGTGAISLNSSFNNNNNNLTPFLHPVRPKKQVAPSATHSEKQTKTILQRMFIGIKKGWLRSETNFT